MACFVEYNGTRYSEEDFFALLANGELDKLIESGDFVPPKPPVKPTQETSEKKEKRLLNRAVAEDSNLPKELKDKLREHGLEYNVEKQDEVAEYAKWLYDNNGYEESMKFAIGATRTALSGLRIDDLLEQRENATSLEQKAELSEQISQAYKQFDESAREQGRALAFMYYWYLHTESGIKYVAAKVAQQQADAVLNDGEATVDKPQYKINKLKDELDEKKKELTKTAAEKASKKASKPKQPSSITVSKKTEYEKAKADLKAAWNNSKSTGAIFDAKNEAEKWVAMDKAITNFAKKYVSYKGAQLSDFIKEVADIIGKIPEDIDLSRAFTKAKDALEAEQKHEKLLAGLTLGGAAQMAKDANTLEEDIRKENQKISNLTNKLSQALTDKIEKEAIQRIQNQISETADKLEALRTKKQQMAKAIMSEGMTGTQYQEYVKELLLSSDEIQAKTLEEFKEKLNKFLSDYGIYKPEQYTDAFIEAREKEFREYTDQKLNASFRSTANKIAGILTKRNHSRFIDKITTDILYGALDKEAFTKLFYAKYGLTDIETPEIQAKLKEFANNIKNASNNFFKEQEMARFQGYLTHMKRENNKYLSYGLNYFYNNILLHYDTAFKAIEWNLLSTVFNSILIGLKSPVNGYQYMKTIFGKNGVGFNQSIELWKAAWAGKIDARNDFSEHDLKIDYRDYKGKFKALHKFSSLALRILSGLDAIFSTALAQVKIKELMYEDFRKMLNEKGITMSKYELMDMVNNIMGHTGEISDRLYQQALKDTAKQFNTTEDKLTRSQLNDARMLTLYELHSRSAKEYRGAVEKLGITELAASDQFGKIADKSNKWAKRSVLFGTPEGTIGAVATILSSVGKASPVSKIFFATIINAPLNVARFMIDGTPLGVVIAGIRQARGRKGTLITEKFAKDNKIDISLTADEKKEMWIKVLAAQATTTVLIGMMGGFGDDDDNDKLKKEWDNGSWRDYPLYITGDLKGDYSENQQLKKTAGGAGLEEYSLYVKGRKVTSYGNNPMGLLFIQSGLFMDAMRSGRMDSDDEWYKKLITAQRLSMWYIRDIGSAQSIADPINMILGTGQYADKKDLSLKQKIVETGEKKLAQLLSSGFIPGGRVIKSFEEDVRGLLSYDKREANDAYEVMEKMMLLDDKLNFKVDLFGRNVKEQFKVESPFVVPVVRQTPVGEILTFFEKAEQSDPYYTFLSKYGIKEKDKMYRNRTLSTALPIKDAKVDDAGIYTIDINQDQINEINAIRGKYFMEQLNKKEENGKTVLENLNELPVEDADFVKEQVNEMLATGARIAIHKIFDKGVLSDAAFDAMESEKEDEVSDKMAKLAKDKGIQAKADERQGITKEEIDLRNTLSKKKSDTERVVMSKIEKMDYPEVIELLKRYVKLGILTDSQKKDLKKAYKEIK